MTGSSKLLVVERLVPGTMRPEPEHRLLARADLHMLVAHAALERTEAHFRELLGSAGFTISRVMPPAMGYSLIEAVPWQSAPSSYVSVTTHRCRDIQCDQIRARVEPAMMYVHAGVKVQVTDNTG
jgi:hypothetical protein